MVKQKVLNDIRELKQLVDTSKYRENKQEILVWGLLVTIGYILTHFLQSFNETLIPFVWLLVVPIGIANSIITERKERQTLGENKSYIGSRLKFVWLSVVPVGFLITYFSAGLKVFPHEFIPVFWFLMIGIALLVQGTFTAMKWAVLGAAFIASGILLALNSALQPYWALLFALVHGGGFIIIALSGNGRNK